MTTKASVGGESRGKLPRRSPRGRTSSGRRLSWVRRLILLGIVVALLYWQWSTITSWVSNTWGDIVKLFGWGLLIIAIAVGVLVGLIVERKLPSLVYHWNRWLGGIAFVLVVWGILAFFRLGGSVGRSIIDFPAPDYVGILRIVGLVIIGAVLVAPGTFLRFLESIKAWLGKEFQRREAPGSAAEEHQPPLPPPTYSMPVPPAPAEKVVPPPVKPVVVLPEPPKMDSETKTATPLITPTPAQQELRQVAQEVWKKYGESSAVTVVDGWRLPPIDILDVLPNVEFGQADDMQRAALIEEALVSYGVEAKVVQINAGPTVTQFGVEPGWDRKMREVRDRDKDGNITVRLEEVSKTRVKVERITSLANNLALALAASSIRIEAPVPGKAVVGIEVPNTTSSVVNLRGVIETNSFQKILARSTLSLALGKGAGGEAIAADLTKMPHLLIAGATGSGKTVCLNSIICCLLVHNIPNDVKFIMVDPKRVELTPFNSIPHLAAPVIVDVNKALSTLRWLNLEMDKRYQKLATSGARNIEGYNRSRQGEDKFPYLVLVIDELADLMMAGFDEVEHILCRLAQLARATGIHLIVATQRPSVDVVTGLIKANFPTRISFAVTSQVDSRTILDMGGAEKLLGRGDMLYMPTEAAKPNRLQGCYVSDAETERLVYFWGSQRKEEAAQLKIEEPASPVVDERGYPNDSLLEAARQLAREHEHISTSFLQRKLRIGYPRAARIVEQLGEERDTEVEE
ncbi:MAG: cell division protein FtsK [Dehalococcoidales bacterium]|nr:cell division protein FtsK [Dehalococcoidales bacterium]